MRIFKISPKAQSLISLKIFLGLKHIKLASIDPFHTDEIRFNRDTGAVSIDAEVRKMIIKGLSNAKFKKFKGFDNNLLEINLVTPRLTFSGPYKSKAQILYVPFDNSGDFLVHMCKFNFIA
jgi:hypothetical protein